MVWVAEEVLQAVKKLVDLKAGVCVLEADIAAETQMTAKQIEQACLKLRKHGWLVKTEQGCHRLTASGVQAIENNQKVRSGPTRYTAPKINKSGLRIRAWRAIRIRTKFSLPELCMLIAEGEEKDAMNNLGKYIRALTKAGYLQVLKRKDKGTATTSNGFKRYLLLRNTGPLAPVWRVAKKTVYDPNTEEEFSLCG